jgi:acyl-coenzyme A thioesterase PaaI-like protein
MSEAPKLPLEDNGLCFGCGNRNPIGLRLTFHWDGNIYSTRYVPKQEHQGWAGRTHGGMIALVLDEVLSRAALEQFGLDWVTAELTTRLVKPAPIGEALLVRGWVETVRSKMIVCVGDVIDEKSGVLIARGQAKMMRPLRDAEKEKIPCPTNPTM